MQFRSRSARRLFWAKNFQRCGQETYFVFISFSVGFLSGGFLSRGFLSGGFWSGGFLSWYQASQYGSRLDWSRDEFCQSLYENSGPKPVLFVSKAITGNIGLFVPVTKRLIGLFKHFKLNYILNAHARWMFRSYFKADHGCCFNWYTIIASVVYNLRSLKRMEIKWRIRNLQKRSHEQMSCTSQCKLTGNTETVC